MHQGHLEDGVHQDHPEAEVRRGHLEVEDHQGHPEVEVHLDHRDVEEDHRVWNRPVPDRNTGTFQKLKIMKNVVRCVLL